MQTFKIKDLYKLFIIIFTLIQIHTQNKRANKYLKKKKSIYIEDMKLQVSLSTAIKYSLFE